MVQLHMIRKIVDVKSPILREKAKPVEKVDKKITQLINDMKETLRIQSDPEGIGLAAPQVGKSIQLFIVNYEGLERVIINPKIISTIRSKKTVKKTHKKRVLEGCLSLPHYYGPITRAHSITISYLDENGNKKKETFSEFQAQIIQHEIDHLNGVLFIDHILQQKSPLYKFTGEEWEEVELI